MASKVYFYRGCCSYWQKSENLCAVILIKESANDFSLFHQITTYKERVINEGCQLTPTRVWALVVFGNITLVRDIPDGMELFIKCV